jgi:glycosyltransferase involved in cell wall biosynthesis
VRSLLSSLRARGHQVVCLAGDPRGERSALPLAAPVEPETGILHYPTRGWSAVHGLAPRRLQALLERLAPDLVHLASPAHIGVGIAIACRELGIPWVVTMMDYWWICPRGTLLREGSTPCDGTPRGRACLRCILASHPPRSLRGAAGGAPSPLPLDLGFLLAGAIARGGSPADALRWLRRRELLAELLGHAARVLFPSAATRDRIARHLGHDRWELLPYGLEPAWFENPHREQPRARAPADLVVGFAGSLQPHKGPDLLLAAAERLGWRETRLRIAGTADDAAYLDELRRLARGLRVEFTGPLSADAMRGFLREVDVLVVASRWPENLPYVLLEAQAARLPVIGSDVAGIADRIADARLRFAPGSADDLARALRTFQTDPGPHSSPRVDTIECMAHATEAAYRKALAHHGRSASLAAEPLARGQRT